MNQPGEETQKGKTTAKLMQAIPFTENDLAENRKFKLSEPQKERIKPKVDLCVYLSAIGVVVFFFMTLAFAYNGIGTSSLLLFAGFCAFAFLAGLIGFIWSLKLNNLLKNNEGIKIIAGEADFDISYEDDDLDRPIYSLTIKEIKFIVNEKIYDAFIGKRFRIYYYRVLKNEILSVEVFD